MLGLILLLVKRIRRQRHDNKALSIRKRVLVSGGSVDRWYRYVEESQVDEQLSTMVIPVIKQERP